MIPTAIIFSLSYHYPQKMQEYAFEYILNSKNINEHDIGELMSNHGNPKMGNGKHREWKQVKKRHGKQDSTGSRNRNKQ